MKRKFFTLCLLGTFLGAAFSAYEGNYAATMWAAACCIWICVSAMREKGGNDA